MPWPISTARLMVSMLSYFAGVVDGDIPVLDQLVDGFAGRDVAFVRHEGCPSSFAKATF